jgi:hypothetical protein
MLNDAHIPAGAFLAMIEDQGLTGTWHWCFATGEQAWSPGLFRLLGLQPGAVRPSYERLLACLHPEDRPILESAAEVRTGSLHTHVIRVVRPDGGIRTVSSRGAVRVDPAGRPRSAGGLLLDVTERESLARAQRAERRRRWAVFEQTQSWTNATLYVQGQRTGSEELLSLTGLTQEAYQADCTRVVAPEDRARTTERIRALMAAGRPFEIDKRLILADGGAGHFRFVYAPIQGAGGTLESWATLASRIGGLRAAPVDPQVLRALETGIGGAHLRAARALLDWSMADLAEASGLSFSTVRRLEEDDPGALRRSRSAAVAALRRAGIGFLVMEGNAVAVVREGGLSRGVPGSA